MVESVHGGGQLVRKGRGLAVSSTRVYGDQSRSRSKSMSPSESVSVSTPCASTLTTSGGCRSISMSSSRSTSDVVGFAVNKSTATRENVESSKLYNLQQKVHSTMAKMMKKLESKERENSTLHMTIEQLHTQVSECLVLPVLSCPVQSSPVLSCPSSSFSN